jgi:Domain of unknown function (DUF1883)/TIR domain
MQWNFLDHNLSHLNGGDIVEVTLTAWANVFLVDNSNFERYRRGDEYRYYGGLAKQSPTRITVPSSGYWHCVVDTRGLANATQASVRVVHAAALRPLPPIQEHHSELAQIVANAAALAEEDAVEREYDVFISHAAEDKDAVVRPLALALEHRNLAVWYDETALRVGDSLRRKIDQRNRSKSFWDCGSLALILCEELASIRTRRARDDVSERPAGNPSLMARDLKGRGDAPESVTRRQSCSADFRLQHRGDRRRAHVRYPAT